MSASFLLAAGGAAGVSAGNTNGIKGSDVLFDFTTAIFAACPGVAGTYAGSGSSNGQAAMVVGTQTVAPMTTLQSAGICKGSVNPDGGAGGASVTVPVTAAEGLVIGLDGLSVVGSKFTLGPSVDGGGPDSGPVCNQQPNTFCDPAFEPDSGAAYNTAVSTTAGTYTFNNWRDVLRVLFAGFDHSSGSNYALRNCSSPARLALANTWGNFFENQCQASSGESTSAANNLGSPCTAIRHLFRRDDFAGVTNSFLALLGLPSVTNPETTVTVSTATDGGVTTSTLVQHTGATPFCNAVLPSFVFPTTAAQPTCLVGSDATWDPTSLTIRNPACTVETAVYVSSQQDNDPIRRTCAGSGRGGLEEDVCSHSGDLGLVLPLIDVPEPNSGNTGLGAPSNVDRFNAVTPLSDGGVAQNPCVTGKIAAGPAPDVYDAITQAKITARAATGTVLCPNGDITNNLGACIVPATSSTPPNPQCLALKPTIPGTPLSNKAVPVSHPVTPALGDGREYNQHLYANSAGSAVYQTNGFVTRPLPITGAYYRIHANHSLNPITGRTCQEATQDDQVGCLVEASPCSLGFAGRGTVENSDQNGNVNTEAIKINAQSPAATCITGSPNGLPDGGPVAGFTYPFSRKLYLNSDIGFGSVNGQELQLAGCETDIAQPSLTPPTPGGLVSANATTQLSGFGFLNLPATVNGGSVYCEDFDEQALCGVDGGTNVNACAASQGNLVTSPTFNFNTTCGNGVREPFEDCDCGDGTPGVVSTDPQCTGQTKNGSAPLICSTTCRLN